MLITTEQVRCSEPDLEDRELIYSIIYDCAENGAFSNLALSRRGVDDFVRAAVYGTLTYIYSIDYLLKSAAGKDASALDPRLERS